ncbi:MAG: NAD(P)/FAD-dependent oxidoreductase [Candidatus Eisenbacteria sp.]|nr:NAD(P)/FAD-dependent oxidoreductase [Candidatus Eisenbacteria bacterium]
MSGADVVVVGAGPAGCAAAVQCRRLGLSVLLLEESGEVGGLACNAQRIENYPGLAPLSGPEFAARLAAHLSRFEVTPRRERVETLQICEEGFSLRGTTADLGARAVIVATGTRPRRLTIPGAAELEGRGLYYEYRHLQALPIRSELVIVIGGGEAACDYALSLASAGARVRLLIRGRQLRVRGHLFERVMAQEGIECLREAAPVALDREGRQLQVTLADSRRLRAVAILAAVGRFSAAVDLVPSFQPADGTGIGGGNQGLFVVGDARRGRLGQVGIAVGDGLAAAMDAARLLEGTAADRAPHMGRLEGV